MLKRILRSLAIAYTFVSLTSLLLIYTVLPTFHERSAGASCYITDAMLPYVECSGFWFSSVASFLLNQGFVLVILPYGIGYNAPITIATIALGGLVYGAICYSGYRLVSWVSRGIGRRFGRPS